MAFRKGDVVEMTADAIENYGEKWAGEPLKITHVATMYMPADRFFATGRPNGYHPGYDEGVGKEALYDLETLDGEALGMSLYHWELEGRVT